MDEMRVTFLARIVLSILPGAFGLSGLFRGCSIHTYSGMEKVRY